jgi:redox-sensitive bicupin YhaK (pirin superfamily)
MSEQARTVARVVTPEPVIEGAGVRLKRSIATPALDYVDPFLLFDHFGSDDPDDYLAGFPWHPHRGIETVTYMLAGEVDHRDSIGNAGRIGAGDVQWMTAGGGIMHEEMPQPGDDGLMGGFQLWVNLPASLKMSHPRYQDLGEAQIPEVRRDDGSVIRVVAGEVDGVRGAVTEIYAEPEYLDVSLPAGTAFAQPVPRGHSALAYAFEGEGRFGVAADLGYGGELDGVLLKAPQMAVFDDGDVVQVKTAGAPVRFLLISGKPLGEPIARYGPFVMNSREELMIALRDLQNDAFVWRDDLAWAAKRRTWSGEGREK